MRASPLLIALLMALASSPSLSQSLHAHHQHHSGAATQPPARVMGGHLHEKGKFMVSYRYMKMDMETNRVGSQRVSAREIVGTSAAPGQFIVAPTSMPMQMHMLSVMYGFSDEVTLMAMLNYTDNEMAHLVRNGRTFVTESSGIGDVKIGALVRLYKSDRHIVHLNLAASLPIGSTDERDDTPVMPNAVLPYPMQLGSGTVDLLPGITYNGNHGRWAWGRQIAGVLRLADNDEGYTLGDRFSLTTWVARDVIDNVSLSLSLNNQHWGNIDGQNNALNPRLVQTADTQLQGGQRMELSLGLNYQFGFGHLFAIDYGQAISETLDGPQLGTDASWTMAWQKSF